MKLLMMAIYDSKAEVYSRPFFAVAAGSAVRSFDDAVNDGKSEYSAHPGDYTLFLIGEYDDSTGQSKAAPTFTNLGNGISYMKSDPCQLQLLSQERGAS